MPLYLLLPYIVIEALGFWLVSTWLGVGWALLLLVVVFFGGLFLATAQMQAISRAAATQQLNPGQALGEYGLTAAGAFFVALPGFVTSIVGLILIVPFTRRILRRFLAKRMRTALENIGARGYRAASSYRQQASYGSFSRDDTAAERIVIDETEIQEWSRNVKPEDFTDDDKKTGD